MLAGTIPSWIMNTYILPAIFKKNNAIIIIHRNKNSIMLIAVYRIPHALWLGCHIYAFDHFFFVFGVCKTCSLLSFGDVQCWLDSNFLFLQFRRKILIHAISLTVNQLCLTVLYTAAFPSLGNTTILNWPLQIPSKSNYIWRLLRWE